MRKIFFDLDGTLLDSKNRLYNLFCELVKNNDILNKQQYWNLKRFGKNHEKILTDIYGFDEKLIEEFQYKWMKNIEKDSFLSQDTLYSGILELLENLSTKGFHIVIITNRQSKPATVKQLTRLKIFRFIDRLLVTEQVIDKTALIKLHYEKLESDDILVGDTGTDIQVAKNLNIKSIAVCAGFRNESYLRQYIPDYILPYATNLFDILIIE